MTHERSQHPNQPHQQFEGVIRDVTVPVQETGDYITVQMLTATLRHDGDDVFIPVQPPNPALGTWGGEAPIATIEFGSYTDKNPQTGPFETRVFSVNDGIKKNIRDSYGNKHGSLMAAVGDDDYLLVVQHKGSDWIEGYALIRPSTGYGQIGRRSNIGWFQKDGMPAKVDSDGTPITPFAYNRTISRDQIIISNTDVGLFIKQRSENSPTQVVTRATDVHSAYLESQQTNKTEKKVNPKVRSLLGSLAFRKTR
ncbi:MAG TPA: hypothetical protein VFN56_00450 [Candidatus Saccharimonadales bacterium]|nr:hypothetical protein [Candidatus Saccharimonadales bacterium]